LQGDKIGDPFSTFDKKRLKSSQFIPQGYEFPFLMVTFANGSGRIDINLFLYLFAPP
jgi:hypothetical protein